jgi:hypothetical protein
MKITNRRFFTNRKVFAGKAEKATVISRSTHYIHLFVLFSDCSGGPGLFITPLTIKSKSNVSTVIFVHSKKARSVYFGQFQGYKTIDKAEGEKLHDTDIARKRRRCEGDIL